MENRVSEAYVFFEVYNETRLEECQSWKYDVGDFRMLNHGADEI